LASKKAIRAFGINPADSSPTYQDEGALCIMLRILLQAKYGMLVPGVWSLVSG